MPTVRCPHCGMTQTIPADMLGEDVDCPGCGVDFEAETDGRPDRPRAGDDVDSMLAERRSRRARTALLVRLAVVGVLMVAVMSVFAAIVVNMGRKKPGDEETAKADSRPKPAPARVQPAVQLQPRPRPQSHPTTDTDLRGRPDDFPAARPPTGNPFFDPPGHGLPAPPFPAAPAAPAAAPPTPRPAAPVNVPPPEPHTPFVSDRPAKETFPGYYERKVNGFKVYVSRLAYENSDERRGEPLKVVDDELARIVDLFPPDTVKGCRLWPVWVEWDHTLPQEARAYAAYFGPTGDVLLREGIDPRKSDCVCILSLKTAVALKGKGLNKNTLIHEFAHLVHAKVYKGNTLIRNAYQQAMARHLYDRVRYDNGLTRRAYAATNEREYFAELSCAYFDSLEYPPHDHKELRELDSVGYELMTKAWGTPEEIAKLKKRAAARATPKKR